MQRGEVEEVRLLRDVTKAKTGGLGTTETSGGQLPDLTSRQKLARLASIITIHAIIRTSSLVPRVNRYSGLHQQLHDQHLSRAGHHPPHYTTHCRPTPLNARHQPATARKIAHNIRQWALILPENCYFALNLNQNQMMGRADQQSGPQMLPGNQCRTTIVHRARGQVVAAMRTMAFTMHRIGRTGVWPPLLVSWSVEKHLWTLGNSFGRPGPS
ncbi:hypothetical protein EJ06DRAFT_60010 [Trichodelitschia bisporula]|uniref:Uncharacterized protein n=1 Tax=Trichodelitschia bisporula TaxID=703511 RepID=A0A6G1HUW0_9PEZI|nr:hypothetical protein EJ06DRAFT_60010 [Trichodelitschia bisporula]